MNEGPLEKSGAWSAGCPKVTRWVSLVRGRSVAAETIRTYGRSHMLVRSFGTVPAHRGPVLASFSQIYIHIY